MMMLQFPALRNVSLSLYSSFSCNFQPCSIVPHFHVSHFQSTRFDASLLKARPFDQKMRKRDYVRVKRNAFPKLCAETPVVNSTQQILSYYTNRVK